MRRLSAVVVAVLLVVAGCGSSAGNTASSTPAPLTASTSASPSASSSVPASVTSTSPVSSSVSSPASSSVSSAGTQAVTTGSPAPSTGTPSTSGGGSGPASTPTAPRPPVPTVSDGDAERLPELPVATAPPTLRPPSDADQVRAFVASVFRDVQASWRSVFDRAGLRYTPARMVLFDSTVHTGCGTQSAQVGPFYCPADHTVYLDVGFFDEMERMFGVRGGFAMAYVVAHEVGHHIQTITGLTGRVAAASQAQPAAANALSVLTELQADCYAGVWAHTTYQRNLLRPGDLSQALHAAAVVGDDFQQRAATGTVHPEQWTHGSSAQRQHWLIVGFDSGRPASCDTFSAAAG